VYRLNFTKKCFLISIDWILKINVPIQIQNLSLLLCLCGLYFMFFVIDIWMPFMAIKLPFVTRNVSFKNIVQSKYHGKRVMYWHCCNINDINIHVSLNDINLRLPEIHIISILKYMYFIVIHVQHAYFTLQEIIENYTMNRK
jgi:hypothetical protein